MTDREKVIKGLECCFKYETHLSITGSLVCEECPYNKDDYFGTCTSLLLKDALELLKEREPKRMRICDGELYCPQCGAICKSYYHYCDECGQAVMWDEAD